MVMIKEAQAKYLTTGKEERGASKKVACPDGYKLTEMGVIPDDWDKTKLIDIAEIIDGDRGSNYPKKSDLMEGGYCLFLNAGNVTKKGFKFSRAEFIDIDKHEALNNGTLQQFDMVLTTRGTIGNFAFFDDSINYDVMRINSGMVIIRINILLYDPHYLYYFCSSSLLSNQINSLSFGSAQPQLTVAGIRSFKLVIPSSKIEQKSIAKALSDIDALISSLEKLIAKKQAIKTATMQQLLTGKTRLPGFGEGKGYKQTELGEIPEDWEVLPLKKCLKENPKYGINAPAVKLQGNLPVYIRITDISEDGYFRPIEKVGVNSPFSALYTIDLGDLVVARTGASVGKSYLYRESDGDLIYAGFLIKLSPNKKVLLPLFLFQYLKTEIYWSWVNVMSMRSGQPGINGNEYGQLLVPIPLLKEQAAITDVLSEMDFEIVSLQKRLTKTQQIKQGMMQELLTGKTRLI